MEWKTWSTTLTSTKDELRSNLHIHEWRSSLHSIIHFTGSHLENRRGKTVTMKLLSTANEKLSSCMVESVENGGEGGAGAG